MKVLHILFSSSFSGAENVAITIIKGMGNGIESYYCSVDGEIRSVLRENNIEYIPIEKLSSSEIKRVINKVKPDIIHTHDFKATIKTVMSTKLPIVAHIHQNPQWLNKVNLKASIFTLISFRLKKIIWVNDNISILPSIEGVIKRKSCVIKNILDGKSIREKALIENYDNPYDIAFVGRLTEVKDPLRFIRITKMLTKEIPNIKVNIIGDGKLKSQCEELIKQFGLSNNITLKGFVDNPISLLNKGKVLVMTSLEEGAPMVIIEAFLLNKPVIVPNLPTLKYVKEENLGLVCKSDEEYVKALINILNNKDKYDFFARNIADYSKYNFNIDTYIDKVKSVYEECYIN